MYSLAGNSWALSRYKQSWRIMDELGNRAEVAVSLHHIGLIHQYRGEYAEALSCYEQSMRINEELGNRAGVAGSLHQVGLIHQRRGEHAEALSRYKQSLRTLKELGNHLGVATSLGQIGQLFTETGRYEEAFTPLLNALATFLQLQSPNARLAANTLSTLRARWGEQAFDAAWRAATGEDVPKWLQEASDEAS